MVERGKPKSTSGRENGGYGRDSTVGGFRTWVSVMALSSGVAMAEMSRELKDSRLNLRLWVLGLRITRSPQ